MCEHGNQVMQKHKEIFNYSILHNITQYYPSKMALPSAKPSNALTFLLGTG